MQLRKSSVQNAETDPSAPLSLNICKEVQQRSETTQNLYMRPWGRDDDKENLLQKES